MGTEKSEVNPPKVLNWHVCPTCEEAFTQEFWHCGICGNHNQQYYLRCLKCEASRLDQSASIPINRYDTSNWFDCNYGIKVSELTCVKKKGDIGFHGIRLEKTKCKSCVNYDEIPF